MPQCQYFKKFPKLQLSRHRFAMIEWFLEASQMHYLTKKHGTERARTPTQKRFKDMSCTLTTWPSWITYKILNLHVINSILNFSSKIAQNLPGIMFLCQKKQFLCQKKVVLVLFDEKSSLPEYASLLFQKIIIICKLLLTK